MRVWGLKNLGRPIYIEQTVLSGRRKPLPPSTKTFLENGAEVIYECRANGTLTLSTTKPQPNTSNFCILHARGRKQRHPLSLNDNGQWQSNFCCNIKALGGISKEDEILTGERN